MRPGQPPEEGQEAGRVPWDTGATPSSPHAKGPRSRARERPQAHRALTPTRRWSRKYCSRQALRPSARMRSWPRGDLIHGLRCWGRRSLTSVPRRGFAWEAGARAPQAARHPRQASLPDCEAQLVGSGQVTRSTSSSVPFHGHGYPGWAQSKPGPERDRLFPEAGQSHPGNCWGGQHGGRLAKRLPSPPPGDPDGQNPHLGGYGLSPSQGHAVEGRGAQVPIWAQPVCTPAPGGGVLPPTQDLPPHHTLAESTELPRAPVPGRARRSGQGAGCQVGCPSPTRPPPRQGTPTAHLHHDLQALGGHIPPKETAEQILKGVHGIQVQGLGRDGWPATPVTLPRSAAWPGPPDAGQYLLVVTLPLGIGQHRQDAVQTATCQVGPHLLLQRRLQGAEPKVKGRRPLQPRAPPRIPPCGRTPCLEST